MTGYIIGQTHFEAALSADFLECLVATAGTRNREHMPVLCQPLVLLYDTFRNVQKTNIRFSVGLLSSGDYP